MAYYNSTDWIEFFGLIHDPFLLTPDIGAYFPSKQHSAVISVIINMVKRDAGIIVLIGEPGVGKSLTLRLFIHNVPPDFKLVYIINPMLSPHEALQTIISDLGIVDDVSSMSKAACIDLLHNYLISLNKKGKKLIILIDEAQHLPLETFEQLRLLANLETKKEKLVQFILAAQPELMKRLKSKELTAWSQRITVFEELLPLTEAETGQYISHRIKLAGGSITLSKGDMKFVYKLTKGYPRLINKLMSRAFFLAYSDKATIIDKNILKKAAVSLDMFSSYPKKMFSFMFIAVVIIILTGILIYINLGSHVLDKQQNDIANRNNNKIKEVIDKNETLKDKDRKGLPNHLHFIAEDNASQNTFDENITETIENSQDNFSNQTTITEIYNHKIVLKEVIARSNPGFQYPLRCKIYEGDRLSINATIGRWAKIISENNCTGWIPLFSLDKFNKSD